jgi:hypothetical protein
MGINYDEIYEYCGLQNKNLSSDYYDYFKSDYYKQLRKEKIEANKKLHMGRLTCEECEHRLVGIPEMHHLTYIRFQSRTETIEDFQLLCHDCHISCEKMKEYQRNKAKWVGHLVGQIDKNYRKYFNNDIKINLIDFRKTFNAAVLEIFKNHTDEDDKKQLKELVQKMYNEKYFDFYNPSFVKRCQDERIKTLNSK